MKIVIEIVIGLIIVCIGLTFNVCLYQLQKEKYKNRMDDMNNGLKKNKRNG